MKPSTEGMLAEAFENAAVADARVGPCSRSLAICRPAPDRAGEAADITARFEVALSRQSSNGSFPCLEETEYQKAFQFLVRNEERLPAWDAIILLSHHVEIKKWRVKDAIVPTLSTLSWGFGSHPHISTLFYFNTRTEFDFIQSVFERLNICRLNERHLRLVKSGEIENS
ncbi:MAG: hypothetical protein LBI02_09495 [Opitutaceae bacterium]|jgi:hypothetical protein|nr:hypothetical protein [Opitutaceae bacterium]